MNNQTKILFDQKTGRPIKAKSESILEQKDSKIYFVPFEKGHISSILITNRERKIGDKIYPRARLVKFWDFYYKNPTQLDCVNTKTNWAIGRGCNIVPIAENPDQKQFEQLNKLKTKPNTNELFSRLIYRLIRDYYVTGNSFLIINRSRIDGEIFELSYQPSHLFVKSADRPGYFFFKGKEQIYYNDYFNVDQPSSFDVIHLKNEDELTANFGIPLVFSALEYLNTEESTVRHIRSYYENSAQSSKAWIFKAGQKTEEEQREFQKLIETSLIGQQNAYGTVHIYTQNPAEDVRIEDLSHEFDEGKITQLLDISQAQIMRSNNISKLIIDGDAKEEERFNFREDISVDQMFFGEVLNRVFMDSGITDWKIKFIERDITLANQDAARIAQLMFGTGKAVEQDIITQDEARDLIFPMLGKLKF